jgi:hypothetical protein
MTKDDRNRAEARFNKAGQVKSRHTDRDAAAKAVLDNMAKLKALRLAREAAEPPPVAAKKARAKSPNKPANKSGEKSPALSDWLAGQQSGGRRT